MIAKRWNCLAVATASICAVFGQLHVAQGATPGTPKWSPLQAYGTFGKVSGSPAISGDSIYITSEDGYLYRINATDGPNATDNWSVLLQNFAGDDPGLISSPVIGVDGKIYVASRGGYLYQVDPITHTYQNPPWPLSIQQPETLRNVGAIAVASSGILYVTYDDDNKLHAIDPTGPSGQYKVWDFDLSQCVGSVYIGSAPAVGPDGTVYFYADDRSKGFGKLFAVDCGGNFKWKVDLLFYGENSSDFVNAPVVDANGTIYVPYGSSANQLLAINPDGSSKWTYPASGTIGTIHSSPAIDSNGTLYFGSDDGNFYAVYSNGSQKWAPYHVGAPITNTAALGSDNRVYFGGSDGRMRALDTGTGALVWQYPLVGQLGAIRSSPALGSDALYFGSDDNNVYAVYASASLPTTPNWPMFQRNVSHTASQATSATCDTPAWISPTEGQSFTISQCSCILLKVHASTGTQIDFYTLINGTPVHLNGGTAGTDGTYSFNWCQALDGNDSLYFEARGPGGFVSTICPPLSISVTHFTDPACPVVGRIAAGLLHSLALKYDGTVWAWGDNSYGQLGIGNNFDSSTPVQVQNLNQIVAIAAGWTHNLALQSDGTVWAWGRNNCGQLGSNYPVDQNVPVPVPGLSGVTQIAAGAYHSLARSSGDFVAWGYNTYGQLGDGSFTDKHVPTQVSRTSGLWYYNITAIGAGAYHSLAVDSGGQVWAWGANSRGQLGLGNGNTSLKNTPQQIVAGGGDGIRSVCGGLYHSLALDANGYVWAWGDNTYGQLGSGTTGGYSATATLYWYTQGGPQPNYGVQSVAAGAAHSLAVDRFGYAWSWGYNDNGQLGNNSHTISSSPVQASGPLSGMTTVSGGGHFSLSTGSPTAIYSWGANSDGQLGNGNPPADQLTPTSFGFNF